MRLIWHGGTLCYYPAATGEVAALPLPDRW